MKIELMKTLSSYALYGALAVLVGCGGATDTAPENEENQQPAGEEEDDTLVYNGPLPENDDVANFKLYIWDLLASEDRCGECHVVGGAGSPAFVRRDDIHLAYDEAFPALINLESPSDSLIYTRVADGHNPWDGGAADTINRAIFQWRTASGASATEIVLDPPENPESVDETFVFTDTAQSVFEATLYPFLRDTDGANCGYCHAEDTDQRQQPFHSSIDPVVAFSEVRSLIELDINNVGESRLVTKVAEGHNTWADPSGVLDNVAYSSQQMEIAIRQFLEGGAVTTESLPEEWIVSRAASLDPASGSSQVISAGGRIETNVIALYQFRTGEGRRAFDVSGVDPAAHLDFSGEVDWLGSWGIRFSDNAIAKSNNIASQKLNTMIRQTSEYSIEAWVIPGNVTQEESRIVTYSGNDRERNFALMQNIYDYDFYTRNESSDLNGEPLLNTPSADEVLQATLQHVVATYDPIEGRRIYVNGDLIVEDNVGGSINDWEPSFVLALGNELGSTDDWVGTIRLLAIHNRVLDESQVRANFDAGVGQKYFMFFSISDYVPYDEAFVVFTVELFDDNAYLFQEPFFIILDGNDTVPTDEFRIRGMRIGVNGQEVEAGQSFANINVPISASNYSTSTGTPLWGDPDLPYGNGDENNNDVIDGEEQPQNPGPAGTVIAVENGLEDDVFFLTFEGIDTASYDRPADEGRSADPIREAGAQVDLGLRIFDEVFHNMSALSTVPPTTPITGDADSRTIFEFYTDEIRRSLPAAPDGTGFLASQQSAVTQLALAYCTELINDNTLRGAYFSDYGTLSNQAERDALIDPLLDKMLIGVDPEITTSADVADVKMRLDNVGVDDGNALTNNPEEFDGLLQVMASNPSTSAKATAVCTSVLASAAMLMQ